MKITDKIATQLQATATEVKGKVNDTADRAKLKVATVGFIAQATGELIAEGISQKVTQAKNGARRQIEQLSQKAENRAIEKGVGMAGTAAGMIIERGPQIATVIGEHAGRAAVGIDPVEQGIVAGDKIYDTAANFTTHFFRGMDGNYAGGLFNVAATCAVVTGRVLYRTAAAVTGSVSRAWTWLTTRG